MKRSFRIPILLAGGLIFASLACNLTGLAPTPAPTQPQPPPAASPAPAEPTSPVLSTAAPETGAPAPTEANPAPDSTPTQAPGAGSEGESEPGAEYAVVLVKAGDVLNVRKAAGADQAVTARLSPGEKGITLTGREKQVGSDRWVEIRHAQAAGWVNAYYLTEAVSPQDYCQDERVNDLIEKLARAIATSDGPLLASLVSPAHGLNVQYFHNGNVANYTPEEAKWVFQSEYEMDWGSHPASGLEVMGTFHAEVLPTLVEVFESNYSLECNPAELGGGNYTYQWPVEYSPINTTKIDKPATPGIDLDWRTYLAGVEYVGGQPYLFTLIHFFWEP